MSIVDANSVRSFLPGSEMTKHLANAWGNLASQNVRIRECIEAAEASIQHDIEGFAIFTKVVKCWPDSTLTKGTDYDVEEEPYDLYSNEWQSWGHIQLRVRPLQSVQAVSLRFGKDTTLVTFPPDWVRMNKTAAQIHIVPTPGASYQAIALQSGGFLAPYLHAFSAQHYHPGCLCVDYTAGVENPQDAEWADLRALIANEAAQEVLRRTAEVDNIGVAGVSLSGDGLSEGLQFTRFGPRIEQLASRAAELRQRLVSSQGGIMMMGV